MALKSNNLHILCVDDDVTFIKTVTQALTKRGHVVTTETEGLNALRTFSENPYAFDIAILDVSMAKLNGIELAQRFRRIQPGFPVILYGGDIPLSVLRIAEKSGISSCHKPTTWNELETAIRDVLRR